MAESTHDGPVQRIQTQKRYGSEGPDETSAPSDWIAAALDATTIGELEQVVQAARSAGAFDAGDLRWCRALWTLLASDASLSGAIALVRRELGGLEVAS